MPNKKELNFTVEQNGKIKVSNKVIESLNERIRNGLLEEEESSTTSNSTSIKGDDNGKDSFNGNIWLELCSMVDMEDPELMQKLAWYSERKQEIKVIQTEKIDSVKGFYESCITKNIITTMPTLKKLLDNLHKDGFLQLEKHRARNLIAMIYFVLDLPEKVYNNAIAKYDGKITQDVKPSFNGKGNTNVKSAFNVDINDLTAEQLERALEAKKQQDKNKPVANHNSIVNIAYKCLSCRIRRFKPEGEVYKCPECKKEMTPEYNGNVKIEGASQYMKEYDKR